MSAEPEPRKILVVDDDEPTQKLLRALLQRCGFAADIANNGSEALEMMVERDYAVLILDMMMPSVGGREVIDAVTKSQPRTPIIVCSAAGPAALAGFDPDVVKGVIRKPFDVEQFMAAVTAVAAAGRQ